MDVRLYYCFQVLVLELNWNLATGNESEVEFETQGLAPSTYDEHLSSSFDPDDPTETLRRKYKLEDFLWAGSGDGPSSSDQDGGLAWEDNGGGKGHASVILVTKTMVIFQTKVTTVYTVELTPTLVMSSPQLTLTPSLPISVSPSPSAPQNTFVTVSDTVSSPSVIQPTPTYSQPIEQTAVPTTRQTDNDTETTEQIPTPSPDTDRPPQATDPVFWVNTVIKANRSHTADPALHFQEKMQLNLATVYASAFKLHLLNSLGVANTTGNDFKPALKTGNSDQKHEIRRRRREVPNWEEREYEWLFSHQGGLDPAPSPEKLAALATTTMNVSVSIFNVTPSDADQRVSMDYFITAEGRPVPGASAAQDINLMTKEQVQQKIGFEVIKMAEALVSPPPPVEHVQEGGTSTWLVVATSMMFLLVVVVILLLGVIAWKWKQKGIDDRMSPERRSTHSVGVEAGVNNPAFVTSSQSDPAESYNEKEVRPGTSYKRRGQGQEKGQGQVDFSGHSGSSRTERESRQKSLAKDLNERLVGDTRSPSSPGQGQQEVYGSDGLSSAGSDDSFPDTASNIVIQPRDELEDAAGREVTRSVKPPSPKKRGKTALRRRVEHKDDRGDLDLGQKQSRPLSASSREKVTFGHLDVCDDSVAKPVSNEAKKLMTSSRGQPSVKPRSGSSKIGSGISETAGTGFPEDRNIPSAGSDYEQDRDIGDSLDVTSSHVHVQEVSGHNRSPMRDAQVQTPVKLRGVLKKKPKAKPRRFTSVPKKSSESLISTESEEIIEVHGLDDSSSDANTLGKMRKRFHQFLDDAFNVIGKKEGEGDEGRTKSAKVSLTHHIETKEVSRPWTSSQTTLDAESRPKSASIAAGPKRAWTASTEKRCHSATSRTSARSRSGPSRSHGDAETVLEERIVSDDEPDQNSSSLSAIQTPSSDGNRSYVSSIAPLFPRYPIYPDIPYPAAIPDTLPPNTVPPTGEGQGQDPAVPLIAAIKEEIKRFERLKVTEQQQTYHSRWST